MRFETSFEIDGDLIWVEAIVVGPIGSELVRLVLDTGAALTTLNPVITARIGYREEDRVRRTVVRTAAAEERGYVVQVPTLTALGLSISNVLVNVAELGHDIDGVLGMNVLSEFDFAVEWARQRIIVDTPP